MVRELKTGWGHWPVVAWEYETVDPETGLIRNGVRLRYRLVYGGWSPWIDLEWGIGSGRDMDGALPRWVRVARGVQRWVFHRSYARRSVVFLGGEFTYELLVDSRGFPVLFWVLGWPLLTVLAIIRKFEVK